MILKEGKIFLTAQDLTIYFNVKAPTISGWKKRGLLPTRLNGEKKEHYELLETIQWKQYKVKDKFSKNSTNNDETDGLTEIILADGRKASDLNLKLKKDVEILTLHPLGERYMDMATDAIELSKKEHDLAVKKKQYMETSEMDMLISEFIARIKNSLISVRNQLPISQTDKLIEQKMLEKTNKQATQKILVSEADDSFKEMFMDITSTMFQRTPKTVSQTVSFLKDLLSKYEN